MSKRRKLTPPVDFKAGASPEDEVQGVAEGDPRHPVWQSAFGAAFAIQVKKLGLIASYEADPGYVECYAVAERSADWAYATYRAAIGVVASGGAKQTSKRRKDEPSFEFGTVTVEKETEKAILVITAEQEKGDGTWIPKSQIHQTSEVERDGDEGVLLVTAWYAEQRGLVEGKTVVEDDVPF